MLTFIELNCRASALLDWFSPLLEGFMPFAKGVLACLIADNYPKLFQLAINILELKGKLKKSYFI